MTTSMVKEFQVCLPIVTLFAQKASVDTYLPRFLPIQNLPHHIMCSFFAHKNVSSPAPSESLPYWFQGNFAAVFVLN